jgi:thiol-disulfide isomerase/thioredoxin
MTEPKLPSSRIWWIVALVFVSVWCLALRLLLPAAPSDAGAPVLEGTALVNPADYDWSLYDLEGRAVSFGRYRGKTVFLNIWATWCPPCVAELPSIVKLAGNPRLKDVAFVCVAIDDDPETVRRYVQGKDWPMTVLHAAALPPAFTIEGPPTTFLIAPDGRIAARVAGGADWDGPTVVNFLEQLNHAPAAR